MNGNSDGGHTTPGKGNQMRLRIYFRHNDTGKEAAREVEADGMPYRICDDHGRVIFGEPWPKRETFVPSSGGREPAAY